MSIHSYRRGVFISSTSRLVLPVDEVLVPEENGGELNMNELKAYNLGGDEMTKRIEKLVMDAVKANSTLVF